MKDLIILGRGPSSKECKFDAETWATMSCLNSPELRDRQYSKLFAFDPLDEDLTEALKIATEKNIAVVSTYDYATEVYPQEEIIEKLYYGGYLINSICRMIALAILRGYERIRLYGVDQFRGMYLLQKGPTEFWSGVAVGSCANRFTCPNYKKILFSVAPSSMLLSEYLREMVNVVGKGDDEQLKSFPEVIPYAIDQPVVPMMADIVKKELVKPLVKVRSYAFYDLEVAPATYDVITYLVLAEKFRLEHKCEELKVVIVRARDDYRKGDLEGYQQDGDYDRDYMEWRIKNILIPSCWLIPSCRGVMVVDRQEAHKLMNDMDGYLYPEGYRVNAPVEKHLLGNIQKAQGELPSLKASNQARKYARAWLNERAGNRKVVTINLRETAYETDRNSNLKEWVKFYESLNKNLYYPLFVRDMEKAHLKSKLNSYPEVVWNVEMRQALYELSYLNLSVNSGTDTGMLFDKDVNCLIFKWWTPTCGATTRRFFEANGLKFGDQLKHLTERQKIVWEPDSYEIITREFDEMVKKL